MTEAPRRRPGMRKAGDKFYVARHNMSGRWSVRMLDQWNMSAVVKEFGHGAKGTLAARRAIEARNRLQDTFEAQKGSLTWDEMDAICNQVRQDITE